MAAPRMSSRMASIAARQRQTRVGRMTRHTIFTMKRPITFQVRKSLVEYVDMELADMDTSVFYQRIFILAKNCHLTPQETEEEVPAEAAVDQAEPEPAAAETIQFTADAVIENDDEDTPTSTVTDATRGRGPEDSASPEGGASDKEVITHLFRFSEEDQEEEESVEEEEIEMDTLTPDQPKDFFAIFSERLQDLHAQCKAVAIIPDPMCGLYIHMGDYSLLMLESSEDMIGCFTRALADCCDQFWTMNRVFQIEDHVKELHTKSLLFRRIPAVFLNEKFPTSTPTDEYLMGKQHLIIKDKLLAICRLISEAQTVDPEALSVRDSDYEVDIPKMKSKTSFFQSENLQVEVYRKHLPEIQRIELVLASTRFYYSLDEFAGLYGRVPFSPDEDGLFWPIQNNYTPPHIFRRTPYDINLTFADYAAVANKRKTHESLIGDLDTGEEETAEAPPKEEASPKAE
ncbi:uncharacterized protein LOC108099743 [Drosophila ficusphila]|uniref:uncharacterized protein LOC108099743 n=1 Tax=Drosophila ficusphila TaxID=30025 RepID=UPI0007E87222|nr:uncharacterized protein LOC108099743 [Drosophila ficusphila]